MAHEGFDLTTGKRYVSFLKEATSGCTTFQELQAKIADSFPEYGRVGKQDVRKPWQDLAREISGRLLEKDELEAIKVCAGTDQTP